MCPMTVDVRDRHALPWWLWFCFAVSFGGVAWLVCRLVWEQTFLTWRLGPQMVGFSLAHAEAGLLRTLVVSALLFSLLYLAVLILSVTALVRRRRVPALRWSVLLGAALVASLLFVPYSFWQYVFANRLAESPHRAEFLTFAAATGDLRTVEALLERGVPVDSRTEDGSTALYAAAVQGQIPILRYLLAHGADPNVHNSFGSTPLGAAREMKHPRAAEYLIRHGAK